MIEKEILLERLKETLPGCTFDSSGEWLNIMVNASEIKSVINYLRYTPTLDFEGLFCLTAVDMKDHLLVVYHLLSRNSHTHVVVKAKIEDNVNPCIETVSDIWKGANLLEREVFEMFGIKFNLHPNLKKLLLEENWTGFPLRKNYVDDNMIEL